MIAFLLSGLFGTQKNLVGVIVTVKYAPDGVTIFRVVWIIAHRCFGLLHKLVGRLILRRNRDNINIAQQNGCEGTVYKIEICYTTLISIDNKHIVIPNGTLSGSIITNVTARDLRKLEIKVGISYDSDIKKAKAILEEILHNDEDTKDDQGMVVFVDELGESAVVMGLRVWVATEKYWPARWRLNELIKEAFDANGIEIPYSQLQVHVKKQI